MSYLIRQLGKAFHFKENQGGASNVTFWWLRGKHAIFFLKRQIVSPTDTIMFKRVKTRQTILTWKEEKCPCW